MFKPSPHKDEIIQALRVGVAQGINPSVLIDGVSKRFPISKKTVERYYKLLIQGKLEEKETPPTERVGGPFATFVARQPAPVVFRLGEQSIELEPEAIYESYLLYMDMKLRCPLKDSFSNVMRDGVGLLWRILASEPIIEKGKVKMEVSYGGSFGAGEREAGSSE